MKFKVEPHIIDPSQNQKHKAYMIEFDPPAPRQLIADIVGMRGIIAPTCERGSVAPTNDDRVVAKIEIWTKHDDNTVLEDARKFLISHGYIEVRP